MKHRLLSWKCKEGPGLDLCDDEVMMVGNSCYCNGNVNKFMVCTITMIWYNKKMVANTGYGSGNVNNGHGKYLCDGFLMDMIKTWMRTSPAASMKHGWICRNLQWQIVLFNDRQDEVYGSNSDDDSVIMTWPDMLMTMVRERIPFYLREILLYL